MFTAACIRFKEQYVFLPSGLPPYSGPWLYSIKRTSVRFKPFRVTTAADVAENTAAALSEDVSEDNADTLLIFLINNCMTLLLQEIVNVG